MPKITPCLWFDTQAEEAAEFYTTTFENSHVLETAHYGEAGPRPAGMVMLVRFELDGQEFTALNGGPEFTFDEAVSFQVHTRDQEETDRFWTALSEGGEETTCGWLKDKFGLSWQIVPEPVVELLRDPDPERATRAMQAVLGMQKIDIAAVEKAAAG
jgi:predicted 3-demethylubiquinone-9 3-methyltransferase (glyoxalase superfamily)